MILNRDIQAIIQPATAYISVNDAKTHLRVIGTAEDQYILDILDAAFDVCENHLGYPIRLSNVQYTADEWVGATLDIIGKPNSFTNIKYYDNANALQTLATTYYSAHLRNDRTRILFVDVPPSKYDDRLDAIQYNLQQGWIPGKLPGAIRSAVLLQLADLYEERKNEVMGATVNHLTRGTEFLLNPYRWTEFV
jgi:uncharacterized phiE125 gp8 family phage protein